MLNSTIEAIQTRNPLRIAIPTPRLSLRGRKVQEPAASPAESERGSAVLPTTTVRQALAQTWGWS